MAKTPATDPNSPNAQDKANSDAQAKAEADRQAQAEAQRETDAANAAQRLADKAKADAAKASTDAVAQAIMSTANTAGPSAEARAGLAMEDDGSKSQVEATPKSVHSQDFVVVQGQEAELMVLTRKFVELNGIPDPKWDAARLRGEIQMALEGRADQQVKGRVPTAEQQDATSDPATAKHKSGVDLTLTRDYFPEEDKKLKAGSKINVDREEANRLMAAGLATPIGNVF